MNTTEIATATVCPVCSSPSEHAESAPGWGEWRVCSSCTLEFVYPFYLPESPEVIYGDAYKGKRRDNKMEEFNDRLQIRGAILHKDPKLWFWTPAFERTLEWLEQRVGRGATVFEVGCGLGWMLHAMRARGFDAVGLDVAQQAVDLNRADGFRVWHGTIETVPERWVEPDAVVAFFMLHHVPDPVAFLRTLRERYPAAPLSVAQYGPSNRDPGPSSPPRTLTRWNAASLTRALREAQYEPHITELMGTGNEWTPLRPLRKVAKRTIVVPPVYRLARRIEQRFLPRLLAPIGRDAYVLHALAEPTFTDPGSSTHV